MLLTELTDLIEEMENEKKVDKEKKENKKAEQKQVEDEKLEQGKVIRDMAMQGLKKEYAVGESCLWYLNRKISEKGLLISFIYIH